MAGNGNSFRSRAAATSPDKGEHESAAHERNRRDPGEDSLEKSVAAKITRRKPPLGTGARFQNLKESLGRQGVRDPGALAASIGRKKYGPDRFAQLAAKGRKH